MFAQGLDIGHQIPGRVLAQLRMRGGTAASALVEQENPVAVRVKKAAHFRAGAAARPAMQGHHRDALRISGLFPVDFMQIRHTQPSGSMRFMPVIQYTAGLASVHALFTYGLSQ